MDERLIKKHHEFDSFEHFESEEEWDDYLELIAPHIGMIIIDFNQLEEMVVQCIRDLVLRDPDEDYRLDAFFAEMQFSAIRRVLIGLYGQAIDGGNLRLVSVDEIKILDETLIECAKRRNEYAHANWVGIKKEGFVRVKVRSDRNGLYHRYKKFDIGSMIEDRFFIQEAFQKIDDIHDRVIRESYSLTILDNP